MDAIYTMIFPTTSGMNVRILANEDGCFDWMVMGMNLNYFVFECKMDISNEELQEKFTDADETFFQEVIENSKIRIA